MRFGKLPAAEAGAFHLFEQTSHRAVAVDRHGPCRNGQILARFWFSLCDHKLVLPLMKMFTASHLLPSPYGRSGRGLNDERDSSPGFSTTPSPLPSPKVRGNILIVMTPSTTRAVTIKCDIRVSIEA